MFEWIHDDLEEYVRACSSADTWRSKTGSVRGTRLGCGTGVGALDSYVQVGYDEHVHGEDQDSQSGGRLEFEVHTRMRVEILLGQTCLA